MSRKARSAVRLLLGAALAFPSTVIAFNPAGEIVPGRIIDKVVCGEAPERSYALYLPAGYSADRKWPVLYGFDPAGRGRVLAETFRDAAARLGWIVAASNDSRNGPVEVCLEAAAAMIGDVEARFAVAERRRYTIGMSGGARVAVKVAVLAEGRIAGAIGCAAGFPVDAPPAADFSFAYFGLIGDSDFNYNELWKLDRELDRIGMAHQISRFAGGHGYPPGPSCFEALEWMELRAMKDGRRSREEGLAGEIIRRRLDAAAAAETAGDVYRAYLVYAELAGAGEGWPGAEEAARRAEKLASSPEIRAALRREERQVESQSVLMGRFTDLLRRLSATATRGEALAELKGGIARQARLAARGGSDESSLTAYRVLSGLDGQLMMESEKAAAARDDGWAVACLELRTVLHPGRPGLW